MDLHVLKKNAAQFWKKYAYLLIVPVVGIILMTLPPKEDTIPEAPAPAAESLPVKTVQEQLEEILSQVAGAGRVKVLLTVEEGAWTRYQTDSDTQNAGDSRSVRVDTVIVTDRERAQSGLVTQVNPPVYLGAVVVCQGAESAAVRLAITEAVSDATGLTSDKISVLKMK